MRRPITSFRLDDDDDWTALLSCGHAQHVRHNPPFENRPWVTTAAGQASRLGAMLDCVRCDRFEVPESAVAFSRTRVFSQDSIPAGLLRNHATAPGVWARITVTEGALRYRVEALGSDVELSPGVEGTIVPEVPHSVEPVGAVRFFVEFFRAPECEPRQRDGG